MQQQLAGLLRSSTLAFFNRINLQRPFKSAGTNDRKGRPAVRELTERVSVQLSVSYRRKLRTLYNGSGRGRAGQVIANTRSSAIRIGGHVGAITQKV